MNSTTTKQQLRRQIVTELRQIGIEEITLRSHSIWQQVEQSEEFIKAKNIAIYWSEKEELPTHEFIAHWAPAKQFFLPAIRGKKIIFLPFRGIENMIQGEFGIHEPQENPQEEPSAYLSEHFDLMIVPARAYDRYGFRLGRGGGYYDRYLSLIPDTTTTFGVCLDCQLVDSVPHEDFDIPVGKIVCQKGILITQSPE